MAKILPDDYRAYRQAHGKAGSYDDVARWCAGQQAMRDEFEASQEAERRARTEKLRQHIAANWTRFDMMPGYRQTEGD